jgi:hypothetical protein
MHQVFFILVVCMILILFNEVANSFVAQRPNDDSDPEIKQLLAGLEM